MISNRDEAKTDNSKIVCDEIIYVMDNASMEMTNTIAANKLTNSDDKEVRYKIDCYSFISGHIAINNYYYLLPFCKA